jgi:hypothetical protein
VTIDNPNRTGKSVRHFLCSSRNECASVGEPNYAPFFTPASVKRQRNECASVGEPNYAPFFTPASVRRQRNECASVGEPNYVPFFTLASVKRQRNECASIRGPNYKRQRLLGASEIDAPTCENRIWLRLSAR